MWPGECHLVAGEGVTREGVTREGVTGGSPRATLVASVAATESPRPHRLGSEIYLFP